MNFLNFDADLLGILMNIGVSIILGAVVSLSYVLSNTAKPVSRNFALTVFTVPVIVSIIIPLIGSDIARALSLGGVFALVRFRSIPGDSKDILYVFFAMAVGLAVGIHFYVVAALLTLVVAVIFVVAKFLFRKEDTGRRFSLKITVPEDMNFYNAFDDIFQKYCNTYQMRGVKSSNMGTVFILKYSVEIKDPSQTKAFIDEIRCRNGNLNIIFSIAEERNETL